MVRSGLQNRFNTLGKNNKGNYLVDCRYRSFFRHTFDARIRRQRTTRAS